MPGGTPLYCKALYPVKIPRDSRGLLRGPAPRLLPLVVLDFHPEFEDVREELIEALGELFEVKEPPKDDGRAILRDRQEGDNAVSDAAPPPIGVNYTSPCARLVLAGGLATCIFGTPLACAGAAATLAADLLDNVVCGFINCAFDGGQANVIVSFNPSSVFPSGDAYFYRVTIRNTGNAAVTLTRMTVGPWDGSANIQAWFGTTRLSPSEERSVGIRHPVSVRAWETWTFCGNEDAGRSGICWTGRVFLH